MANEVKKLNYYDGLFLKEDQFREEQNYHTRMRRLHNHHLHGRGIVSGLDIQIAAQAEKFLFTAGMALDTVFENGEYIGREIVIPTDREVDVLFEGGYSGGDTVFVWLTYQEVEADVVPELGSQPIHLVETAAINHGLVIPDDTAVNIVLGKIVLDPQGDINGATISYTHEGSELRFYSGFRGQRVQTHMLILDDSEIAEDHAYLDGKLFDGSKNGIDVVSEHTNFTGEVNMATDANVGNGLTVGGNANVGFDIFASQDVNVGRNLTVGFDANVNQDVNVGRNATVNFDANVSQDVNVGRNLTVNFDANVSQDVNVARNVTVGQDVNVTGALRAASAITGNVKVATVAAAVDFSTTNMMTLDYNDAAISGDVTIQGGIPGTVYYLIVKSSGVAYGFTNLKWPSQVNPVPSAAGKRDMYSFICVGANDYLGTFAFNYD